MTDLNMMLIQSKKLINYIFLYTFNSAVPDLSHNRRWYLKLIIIKKYD